MTSKSAVIEMIQRMPDDVSLPEIMEALYVRHKIDEGLRQIDVGQAIEHEEVKKRLLNWLGQSNQ